MDGGSLRRQFLLSTTMLVAAVSGYGRRAYGACVLTTPPSTYTCSGANVVDQTITANNADVSTVAGFSVNTPGGNALLIIASGDLSYTDANASPLTSAGNALYIKSNGDYGLTPGSVTVDTDGVLYATSNGIFARNYGSGAVSITANGDVTGTGNNGIYARNNAAGTDLSVTTGIGTAVTGGNFGIRGLNYGTGALEITANGDVTSTSLTAIYARNSSNGTDLDVTTAAGTVVTGRRDGIFARNYGTSGLEIVADGDVTGTTSFGIYARNSGSDLDVTTGVGSDVTGAFNGIVAHNYGSGDLSVTANGDVTGTNFDGIFARNMTGTDLIVTTGAFGIVTGKDHGMNVRNYSGATTVTANGDVIGTAGTGIYAQNFAGTADLTVTTGAFSTVTGTSHGIYSRNYGTGALSVAANGDVTGTNFHGIFARNSGTDLTVTTGPGSAIIGGRYGIRALNYGAGALTITANGDVTGTNFAGIYAAHFNGGPIDVTVGPFATAAGGTAGVRFVEGAANSLRNFGTVRNLNGIGGTAILGGIGNETVDNFGVVTGDVNLGTGINEFNNMAGGLFNSGATVDLGAGNLLTNDGTLSPGGAFSPAGFVTSLTGNFVQPGSVFEVNLFGGQADRLDVSGSAELDGLVRPLFTLSGLGSSTQWTILTAGTPIQDNGIGAVSTAALTFDLIFPSPTEMDLVLLGVDFAPDGLNRNETSIGNNLTKVYQAGNGGLAPLLDALAILPKVSDLANALDQLSPEIYLDTEIATLFSSLSFADSLMTCPVREGAAAFIKEGQCVWTRLSGRDFEQDRTFQTFGIDETSFQVAGGGQFALGEVWRIGGALGYEHSDLEADPTKAKAEGDRFSGGVALKYNPGALLLAGGVSGTLGSYDTVRPIAFPGFQARAKGDNDIDAVNGRFRAAYQLGSGNWYAKPMLDLDVTHIGLDGLRETGAGAVGLAVRGSDETVLSATPALELGAQFGNPQGTLVRPYVRGGATFFEDSDFVLLASFEGAPGGVGPFRIATATDDVVGNVGAGVDVIGAAGASLRLYYEGSFSDLVEEHGGGVKGTLPF